jgi:hypothetical protein
MIRAIPTENGRQNPPSRNPSASRNRGLKYAQTKKDIPIMEKINCRKRLRIDLIQNFVPTLIRA